MWFLHLKLHFLQIFLFCFSPREVFLIKLVCRFVKLCKHYNLLQTFLSHVLKKYKFCIRLRSVWVLGKRLLNQKNVATGLWCVLKLCSLLNSFVCVLQTIQWSFYYCSWLFTEKKSRTEFLDLYCVRNMLVMFLWCFWSVFFLTCHNALGCIEHVAFYALLLEAAVDMLK